MLSKLQQLKEEREQGFTLIELLVVILIIGILAAIAIPAFLNQRKSAVDSSVQADLNTIAKEVSTLEVKAGGQAVDVGIAAATDDNDKAQKWTVTVGSATNDITLSKGNTFAMGTTESTNGYEVVGNNEGGDVAAGAGFTYNSETGGLNN